MIKWKPYNFSIYNVDGYTLTEVLCNFFDLLKQCVDDVNKFTQMVDDLIEWVKNEGLLQEVKKILTEWEQNDTMADIINEQIFNELNTKIDDIIEDFGVFKEDVNTQITNFKDDVNNDIEELRVSVNEDISNKDNFNNFVTEKAYLNYPDTFVLYEGVGNNQIIECWFDGNLNIGNISTTLNNLTNLFPDNKKLSYHGSKNCLYLNNNEFLVINVDTKNFNIKTNLTIDYNKDKILLNNINGCVTIGDLKIYENYYKKWSNKTDGNPVFVNQKYNIASKVSDFIYKTPLDKTTTFAFITDIHQQEFYNGYYSMGVNIINKYLGNTVVDYVLNGGDNILSGEKIEAQINHTTISNRLGKNCFYTKGNHDGNGVDEGLTDMNKIVTNKDLYNIYCRKFTNKVNWGSKDGLYYYIDLTDKIRLVVINTHDVSEEFTPEGKRKYNDNLITTMRGEQLQWFANTLNVNSKHILILGHSVPLSESDGFIGSSGFNANGDVVRNIIKSYKQKGSYSWNSNNTQYPEFNCSGNIDFTGLTETSVICWLSGHAHYENWIAQDDICYVSRNADYINTWSKNPSERIIGMPSQYSVSLLSVNENSRRVELTNMGYGNNTYWNY